MHHLREAVDHAAHDIVRVASFALVLTLQLNFDDLCVLPEMWWPSTHMHAVEHLADTLGVKSFMLTKQKSHLFETKNAFTPHPVEGSTAQDE